MRIVIWLTVLFCHTVFANSEKPDIILAGSSALSGPAAELGSNLNLGSKIYFDQINKLGGIAGQNIKLITLDDGYEPYKTLKNTQKLSKRKDIFAFFNYVGTPTTSVALPLILQSTLPFLTPFTGAEFLRNPIIDNIYNLRASYYQETQAQIDYLVNVEKINEIGLLIQADEFGVTAEKGYLEAMKRHGLEPVVTTRFRRNTEDISLALNILRNNKVKAVGFVGTYEPLSKLINRAYQHNFTPFFTTVSFISSHELFIRLKQPSRVLVTEVLPKLSDCILLLCQQFITDATRAGITDIDQVQFEGYVNAYLFVEVIKRCLDGITPKCFLDKISNIQFDLAGLNVTFSPDNHQGLKDVYLNFYQFN